jgi:thioredoxin reductase (NADPH)
MDTQVKLKKAQIIPKSGDLFDVIIIGAGPAGMSAALCAGRARLKILILDKAMPGGQTSTAYRIYNYIGFPNGILGPDLAERMEDHLDNYNIYYACEGVEDIGQIHAAEKNIQTDMGNFYRTKAIIIATGLEPKFLDEPFEKRFLGRGISYYAQCDGEAYRDKDVVVIGGGNCACYAAEYLAKTVNKLTLIHRSDYINAVSNLREKIFNNPKIDILWNSEVVDAFGIDHLAKLKVYNRTTQQHTWLDAKAAFIYVGRIPNKTIMSLDLSVDEKGYVVTDEYMRTNIKGVYAAGDIRSKQIRQIATAVSDGMIAAINVERDVLGL